MYDSTMQEHVHEFTGSVKFAERGRERHNHRVACVTGDAKSIGGGRHIHEICTNTDNGDHYHKVVGTTGPDQCIDGTDKHVHLICGTTTEEDNHVHEIEFTTLVNAPTV